MEPFLIISIAFILVVVLERLLPRNNLPLKEGWIGRAVILNLVQFVVVILGGYTWEKWLEGPSLFELPWSPFYNGLFAYLINTWVFYWYHYVRHENNFMWLATHQVHHSPVRIEALTSFYKHPLEILLNSLIITILTCPILGLDAETNAWLITFSALSEFFYHMNIATPYWLGYFIQRPEMHLAHHAQNRQFTCNYGDLPIWDILGGTWFNPTTCDIKTGFTEDRENKLMDMLLFKNILTEKPKRMPRNLIRGVLSNLLFLVGLLAIIGLVFHSPPLRAMAAVTTASPLPFVFSSFNGVETFATTFEVNAVFINGTQYEFILDNKLYSQLKGPYQRRNVIGAVFSHGPFFDRADMIQIRQQILHWAFCEGHLLEEFGIEGQLDLFEVEVKSKSDLSNSWQLAIDC